MICPQCCGVMKVVAFITDNKAVDRIIDRLKLPFTAEKPPPFRVFAEIALGEVERPAEDFRGWTI